ncbi:MAG: ATP-binding cassette domain-containing protein [Deltaproteobacteria bacterium]|nr:MAG: ATP-binding cassette domain-containing protein [Deltaproteobacteria bacterium]
MNALGIEARELKVRWRGRLVLGPLDLDIGAGERVSLHGAAGSGKSALFQALVRRDAYDRDLRVRGSLRLGSMDVLGERRLSHLRQRVGLVPPFPTMLPGTVYDNVAFAPRMRGVEDRGALDALVEQALRTAALWTQVRDRLDAPATEFSVGEQQRIAMARAMAQQPGVLLLDQPFALLDDATARLLEATLYELPDTTVVLATPDERRASRFSPRVIELGGQQKVAHG